VEGEPTWSNDEEQSSRISQGAQRWNAPRSSLGRFTLRGELRNRRPQRLAHRACAVRRPGARGKCGRGTTVLFTRSHARQWGARSVRGGASRVERHANLRSVRPVHATARIFGCMWIAWLVARVDSQEKAKANVGEEQSPFTAVEDSTPRSGCPCIVGLQKSVGRLRAQRSAPSAANGSKARSKQEAGGRGPSHEWKAASAKAVGDRKRASAEGRTRRKEVDSSRGGDPHHVSATTRRSVRGRSRFGAGAAADVLAMEGISGRRSARPSRGPRGTDLGGLRASRIDRTRDSKSDLHGGGDRDARGGRTRSTRGRKRRAHRASRSLK